MACLVELVTVGLHSVVLSQEAHHRLHSGGLSSGLEELEVELVQVRHQAVVRPGDALLGAGHIPTVGTQVPAPRPQQGVLQRQPPPVLGRTEVLPPDLLQQADLPLLLLRLHQLSHLENEPQNICLTALVLRDEAGLVQLLEEGEELRGEAGAGQGGAQSPGGWGGGPLAGGLLTGTHFLQVSEMRSVSLRVTECTNLCSFPHLSHQWLSLLLFLLRFGDEGTHLGLFVFFLSVGVLDYHRTYQDGEQCIRGEEVDVCYHKMAVLAWLPLTA